MQDPTIITDKKKQMLKMEINIEQIIEKKNPLKNDFNHDSNKRLDWGILG